MDWLKQDFTYAVRFLAKRWGVTTVAVVVMGLGRRAAGIAPVIALREE
jgi:hypothetical protein